MTIVIPSSMADSMNPAGLGGLFAVTGAYRRDSAAPLENAAPE
jgi:hypothetical protein